MRKQAMVVIVLIALLTVLVGCSKKASMMSSEQTPPLPNVISEKTEIPVTQSSYCWGKWGCADYAGVKKMLEGKTPTVIPSDAKVKVSFDYNPSPTEIVVEQYRDKKYRTVPLIDGYFHAPKEKGVYYYGISAYWKTADGKYSKGDTSSVFLIEVK